MLTIALAITGFTTRPARWPLGVAALAWALQDPIVRLGSWFVQELGVVGLALSVIVMDSCPIPMTNEPVVLLAITGGMDLWWAFWVAALSSTFAGFVGYSGGWILKHTTSLAGRFRERFADAAAYMERYGAQGVAIAALTPIPFSLSTWSAGLLGVPLWKVMLASTLRIVKTAFYLWLLLQGWSLGT